jgi:hypothetical protein
MAFGRVVQESDIGVVPAPWEAAPNGVVSLLAMLEFAARDYVEIAYQFGEVLATLRTEKPKELDLGNAIQTLLAEANRLGLHVTREALGEFLLEMVKLNPESVTAIGIGLERTFHFKNVGLNTQRTCYHVETIYSTLKAELRTTLFKVIPKERAKYNDPEWLKSPDLQTKFPLAFRELERAGICYSLGQPTACVFHSMRALESGLSALAKPFTISSTLDNWNTIIEQIEKAVRNLGTQQKSQQKSDDEKFYGAATSHLYFVKNAWRNHVSHRLENYSDDDALKILLRTQEFVGSLCERLQE